MTAPGINPSSFNAPYTYGYDNSNRLISLINPFNETTGFTYDIANRLTRKTFANTSYTAYSYDAADQTTGIQNYTGGNSALTFQTFAYQANGNVDSRLEDNGAYTTYSYDGADQLTTEKRTHYYTYTLAFTYDHNGNRLTETRNGVQDQSFTYNGHDVMLSGTGETPQWDYNGNEIGDTLSGQSYAYTYDDEDRLLTATGPGFSDSFSYNGLGLRVGKTDNTGTYTYVCDGTSPGSDVLSDGHLSYTPGISQTIGVGGNTYASHFYLTDMLGSVHNMTDAGQNNTDGDIYEAFGATVGQTGSTVSPFRFGGGSGYQSDADTGLLLLGHRFYNSRIGRFISQDPAGDGDNWYAYCDNSPTNGADPMGLYWAGGVVPPGIDAGDPTEMKALAELNGADPGQTFNVYTQGNYKYSFTIPNNGGYALNSGWALGLGVADQFVAGGTNHFRHYGPTSTQAKKFKESLSYHQVLQQIMAGKTYGGVGTKKAFFNTLKQFFTNGTQAQLGAFKWQFTDPNNSNMGIDISNDVTVNSLFYHIPEDLNDAGAINPSGYLGFFNGSVTNLSSFSFATQWSSSSYGTIHQIIHLNFP